MYDFRLDEPSQKVNKQDTYIKDTCNEDVIFNDTESSPNIYLLHSHDVTDENGDIISDVMDYISDTETDSKKEDMSECIESHL